jgi:hypothetical protein
VAAQLDAMVSTAPDLWIALVHTSCSPFWKQRHWFQILEALVLCSVLFSLGSGAQAQRQLCSALC